MRGRSLELGHWLHSPGLGGCSSPGGLGETYIFFGWVTDAAIGGWGGGLCAVWLFLLLPLLLGQATLPRESHFPHAEGLALVLLDKFFHEFELVLQQSAAARGVLVVDGELVHELAAAVIGTLSARHRLLLLRDELHVLQALGKRRETNRDSYAPGRDLRIGWIWNR